MQENRGMKSTQANRVIPRHVPGPLQRARNILNEAPATDVRPSGAVAGDGNSWMIKPKRIGDRPVVTVRRPGPRVLIRFTTSLARKLGLKRFRYAVIHVDAQKQEVQIQLTNNPAANRAAFAVGFNGGTKHRGDGRIIQLNDNGLGFLENGAYLPQVSKQGDRMVITIGGDSDSHR
jgi:hypothetical protein